MSLKLENNFALICRTVSIMCMHVLMRCKLAGILLRQFCACPHEC